MRRIFTLIFMAGLFSCQKKSAEGDFIQQCTECSIERISYDAGTPQYEISKKNGVKHGLSKAYWDNGKLRSEVYYKDGQIHGPQKMWDKDGKPMVDSFWQNGKCIRSCQDQ